MRGTARSGEITVEIGTVRLPSSSDELGRHETCMNQAETERTELRKRRALVYGSVVIEIIVITRFGYDCVTSAKHAAFM